MAQQREASLAEFVKFKANGAAAIGRVVKMKENENGGFIVLSPALYRANKDEPLVRYEEVAVGLSTDLAMKVSDKDVNKYFAIVLVGAKPTKMSPMKLFNVLELTPTEAAEVARSGIIPEAWTVAANVADAEDALPF